MNVNGVFLFLCAIVLFVVIIPITCWSQSQFVWVEILGVVLGSTCYWLGYEDGRK